MRDKAAYALADRLKQLIFTRTGLRSHELQCPRETSDMTPCVARDGHLAVAFTDEHHLPLCVGCEWLVTDLIDDEKAKHP